MSAEVISLLAPQDHELYVDATFGAGGHTRQILQKAQQCKVIGLDRDESVVCFANKIQEEFKNRFSFIHSKFSNIFNVVLEPVNGIIFDIGVSSMQIDNAERGFSFMRNGPLTMTMGKNDLSAYDVVNKFSEEELANLIFQYGDEPASRKIASAICSHRKTSSITTTLQLVEIIQSVVRKSGKIHPATRTFQAIRVFVNDELNELRIGLESAIDMLAVGGKIILITFQGLENKIVKDIFKKYTHKPKINKFKNTFQGKVFKNITSDPLKPSYEEIRANPRARSASIRAIIRMC